MYIFMYIYLYVYVNIQTYIHMFIYISIYSPNKRIFTGPGVVVRGVASCHQAKICARELASGVGGGAALHLFLPEESSTAGGRTSARLPGPSLPATASYRSFNFEPSAFGLCAIPHLLSDIHIVKFVSSIFGVQHSHRRLFLLAKFNRKR